MKTAVLPEHKYLGWSERTTPLLRWPAPKKTRSPKPIVVPFPDSKAEPTTAGARVHVSKPVVFDLLEIGAAAILVLSTAFLVMVAMAAAANM